MANYPHSLQSSDSPYLKSAAVTVEEHSAAVAEMATFESMEASFGQTFSPFVDEDAEEDD